MTGRAPHLDPRRRPVGRGPGARRRAGRPLRPPAVEQRRQGRQRQPRAVHRQGRLLRHLRRRLRAQAENFLLRDGAVLRRASDVAFVQTPQTYGNLTSSSPAAPATCRPCSTGSSSRAATTSTRPSASAPTWCSAGRPIDDIGGMYTDSKSEDVWTSLMLHERGWRSVYIPDVLAVGDAPETIEGLHQAAAALGDRRVRDPA